MNGRWAASLAISREVCGDAVLNLNFRPPPFISSLLISIAPLFHLPLSSHFSFLFFRFSSVLARFRYFLIPDHVFDLHLSSSYSFNP